MFQATDKSNTSLSTGALEDLINLFVKYTCHIPSCLYSGVLTRLIGPQVSTQSLRRYLRGFNGRIKIHTFVCKKLIHESKVVEVDLSISWKIRQSQTRSHQKYGSHQLVHSELE